MFKFNHPAQHPTYNGPAALSQLVCWLDFDTASTSIGFQPPANWLTGQPTLWRPVSPRTSIPGAALQALGANNVVGKRRDRAEVPVRPAIMTARADEAWLF